ncbi:M23 family metallopeptidase [bacterium]|nr:M23 family metallopeptidase [candidate division CSSED10-310 bacterium]
MRRGWEIAIRDTSSGHYRRIRISRKVVFGITLALLLVLGGFVRMAYSYFDHQSLVHEQLILKDKLNERNTQLRFFADRMNAVRAELASIRRLGQSVEQKLGKGNPVLEAGLGGPSRNTPSKNIKLQTFLNYENEFLEDMWTQMEELESESHYELDRTILLSRFLDSRSGLISALPSIRPVRGGYISSPFGRRTDPFSGSVKMHTGLDIAHSSRVPVYVTADGIVCQVARSPSYGKLVSVYHGYGVTTLYAHLNRQDVNPGDRVVRGQQIGLLGSTGRSTHPHLHYEVRLEGRPVNPYYFFPNERAD